MTAAKAVNDIEMVEAEEQSKSGHQFAIILIIIIKAKMFENIRKKKKKKDFGFLFFLFFCEFTIATESARQRSRSFT